MYWFILDTCIDIYDININYSTILKNIEKLDYMNLSFKFKKHIKKIYY